MWYRYPMDAARLHKADRAVAISITLFRDGQARTAEMEPMPASNDAELDAILGGLIEKNPLVDVLTSFRKQLGPKVILNTPLPKAAVRRKSKARK